MNPQQDPVTRRAWLAECANALFLSATAYSAVTTTTFRATGTQADWISPPLMASIASCGVTAGDHLLAIGSLRPTHQHGIRRALLTIDTSSRRVVLVPSASPPLSITPLSRSQLLVMDDERAVTLFDCQGGHWRQEARRFLPVQSGWNSAALFGRRLVVADDKELAAVDLESGRVAWRRQDLAPSCVIFASPHTAICAFGGGEVVALSAATGQTTRRVGRCHDEVVQMAVDGDGQLLACLTSFGGIEVHSVRFGRRLWVQREHGSVALPTLLRPRMFGPAIGFSPDGTEVVTTASEREWVLATWDARSGERLQTLRGHDDQINGAAYLSDGTLLSWSADSTFRWWDAYRGVAQRTLSIRGFLPC